MSGALAAARREAEEWLAGYDDTVAALPPGRVDTREVRLLRALLAALPGETPAPQPAPTPEEYRAEVLALADSEPEPGTSFLAGAATVAPQAAPSACPHCDEREAHYELGLRMAITDAREYDLAWATWAQKLLDDANRVPELEALLRECNAVCLCGCPESEHESYGEDGESCADEGHECIRVAPAVLEIVQRYRVALAGTPAPRPAQDAVKRALVEMRDDLQRLTGSANYGTVIRLTERLTGLIIDIDAAPAQDAVREAAERADKAMRDVFGGVDQVGDYCGHPVMPGKLAYAVQDLLAALDAAKGPK